MPVAVLVIVFASVIGSVAVFMLVFVALFFLVIWCMTMLMRVVMMMIMTAMFVVIVVVTTVWAVNVAFWCVLSSKQDSRFIFQRGILLGIKLVHAGQYPKTHGFELTCCHIGRSLAPGKFHEVIADFHRDSPLGQKAHHPQQE